MQWWFSVGRITLATLLLLAFAGCDDGARGSGSDTTLAADSGADISDSGITIDTETGVDSDGASDTGATDAGQDVASDIASDIAADIDANGDTSSQDTPDTNQPASSCVGRAFTPPSAAGFRHIASDLLVAVSGPEHSAQDVIVPPSAPITLPGKFAYGRLSKDLEDEDVEVYIDTCQTWTTVGVSTTDSDGRTSTAVDANGLGLGVGTYDVRQVVLGDASEAASQLRLLPAGTHLVVFDIDGTLTTGDSEVFTDAIDEFFFPLYDGTYVPEAYPDAVAITQLIESKGYVLVYLTGRPYWLTRISREWLAELGFASGHLHLTDSNGEALPTEGSVGAYKRDYLQHLQSMGYVIDYAYGNASTDIYAYAEAGVPLDRTWIIGDKGGEAGTQALGDGYTAHLATASGFPDANQPF